MSLQKYFALENEEQNQPRTPVHSTHAYRFNPIQSNPIQSNPIQSNPIQSKPNNNSWESIPTQRPKKKKLSISLSSLLSSPLSNGPSLNLLHFAGEDLGKLLARFIVGMGSGLTTRLDLPLRSGAGVSGGVVLLVAQRLLAQLHGTGNVLDGALALVRGATVIVLEDGGSENGLLDGQRLGGLLGGLFVFLHDQDNPLFALHVDRSRMSILEWRSPGILGLLGAAVAGGRRTSRTVTTVDSRTGRSAEAGSEVLGGAEGVVVEVDVLGLDRDNVNVPLGGWTRVTGVLRERRPLGDHPAGILDTRPGRRTLLEEACGGVLHPKRLPLRGHRNSPLDLEDDGVGGGIIGGDCRGLGVCVGRDSGNEGKRLLLGSPRDWGRVVLLLGGFGPLGGAHGGLGSRGGHVGSETTATSDEVLPVADRTHLVLEVDVNSLLFLADSSPGRSAEARLEWRPNGRGLRGSTRGRGGGADGSGGFVDSGHVGRSCSSSGGVVVVVVGL
ncbi:hypothetical protein SAICODRAFT_224440 [Saitoella complicata NRRL Y-17804]|uniref:uncharacterized protein n=1 Tax=Saitoella complicata (strain BCRC 22490 / CBS 7301 / JCM 7358 / NBRC 10748 / NRRL Y-17804) TaxID=698492 RepID=UPI0008673881|nr:uncharacterized protein SAICODRAFT_224440 [Saitoella complicata NRRL Y-17804]ODQ53757.1 hypothetical protein SAICODRAFT_224440 [Saitoella complicata NRRL Y-17804]